MVSDRMAICSTTSHTSGRHTKSWGTDDLFPNSYAELFFAVGGRAKDMFIEINVIGWHAVIFPKLGAWNQDDC